MMDNAAMTAEEWLNVSEPGALMALLDFKISARKARLFACACAHRVWDQLHDDTRALVRASEDFACGLLGADDLLAEMNHLYCTEGHPRELELSLANATANSHANTSAGDAASTAAYLAANLTTRAVVAPEAWRQAYRHERAAQADLFRHLINPFADVLPFPACVISLADCLYRGDDTARGPLHDSLIEVGHPELAEHFKEQHHPRGCWVLDVLSNRQ